MARLWLVMKGERPNEVKNECRGKRNFPFGMCKQEGNNSSCRQPGFGSPNGIVEWYDRGAKFRQYQQLPPLKEIVLVAQDEPVIERFVRDGDDRVRGNFRVPFHSDDRADGCDLRYGVSFPGGAGR